MIVVISDIIGGVGLVGNNVVIHEFYMKSDK